MRARRGITTLTIAVTAALAAPAVAAQPERGAPDQRRADRKAAERLTIPEPARAAATVTEAGRKARRERRERRQLARGPVHPLAATPDYGTAENAFGAARSGHSHAGQDLFAPAGTPLVAVGDSVVADAGTDGGQGNYVHLYDEDEDRTYVYMHLVAPAEVRTGQRVSPGQRLGGVGCTGSCWGDHLHFEVRSGKGMAGEAIDPLPLLRQWPRVEQPS